MDSIAVEMGAVFLFAALLTFGSAHGLIPRSLRNLGAPILIGVALAGFPIWRFGPDLYANLRSNAAPWFASSEPARVEPAEAAKATAPRPVKSAAPSVKGIVIREVVPAPELSDRSLQELAANARECTSISSAVSYSRSFAFIRG